MKGVIAGVLCAVMIACGAGAQKSAMAPQPASSGATMPGADARSQIEALDQAIATDLATLQIAPPSPAGGATPMTSDALVVPPKDPTCAPGKGPTCSDVCTLADAICANAEKICTIAKDLGNDAWANGKCSGGVESCKAARERCCGCT